MNETAVRPSAANPCTWREGQPLGTFLVRVARMLEDRLDQVLGGLSLSPAKLSVLTQLVQSDAPVALGELASRMSCVRSNVTQLVDRMEADGLVRRVDDPADRRAVRAELTGVGRERQAEGARRFEELEAALRERLTEEERATLGKLLEKLL